ncbi:MAG: Methyltransferase type 11 [Firmicutes bacterium]|nr:Methyltransferase type 11 [Bacillota bacterium]
MAGCSVCPWWIGYFLVNPLRRFIHDPATILSPYIKEGMTVLEPGPGMGFFTLEMANRVGVSGRVIAIDIQAQMLERLKLRALKANVLGRIDARLALPDSLGLAGLEETVDFVFAFAVVHELPNIHSFFSEVSKTLKTGACLLLAEPVGHVSAEAFEAQLTVAYQTGMCVVDRPAIRRSRTAVLKKV